MYFCWVSTKCISSNVLKISEISRVRSMSDFADIFNIRDEIVLAFTEKSKFSFYFSVSGKKLNFFLVISS